MQGVIKAYDPDSRIGVLVCDTDLADYDLAPDALEGSVFRMLRQGQRVIFDLGLVRELGYYTGAVFEVYDPAVGFALGGGGRYDELLGRFGRDLPACGIALDLQRVHQAQAAEEALA